MDMQFHKTMYPCMKRVKWEVQNQEQTQEVRLTDGMPDIGRVLGAWGQVVLRNKEWYSGGMNISGGVMVWLLYAPEDGSEALSMETWIPFQMKWDLPDTQRDGIIRAVCLLRNVDARSISARKLMVRVGVGCLGEALVPNDIPLYSPGELPEDVQLLKNTYPMRLPREAGEKPFMIEEELANVNPKMNKLIYYTVQPEIQDQKVMAGKAVFRGTANVHMLYRGEDGELNSADQELPFSQYLELEREYDQNADVRIIPAVTSAEIEWDEEGQLRLKAGITGQYVIYDSPMIEIVEDAYSPRRKVSLQTETLELPLVLDTQEQMIHAEVTADAQVNKLVDVAFYPDHIRTMRLEDTMELSANGQFQMLYYDTEHRLQSISPRWEGDWSLPTDQENQVLATLKPSGMPQGIVGGGNVSLRSDFLADMVTTAQQGIPMISGLELGELTEPDPNRPSVVLRKTGDDSLWNIAKQCGSTVSAISAANGLQAQPDSNQILLIPVL